MQTGESLFNPFEYYDLKPIFENSYYIDKDINILKNTLPNADKISFRNLTHKIEPNTLPYISYITFYKYNHIFEENTLPENLSFLRLYDYKQDINQCVFPKKLNYLLLGNNYNIEIKQKFFTDNPNITHVYLVDIEQDNINYNLYSSNTCKVYINGIPRDINKIYKYINILQYLKYDDDSIKNITGKIKNNQYVIEQKLNLMKKAIIS